MRLQDYLIDVIVVVTCASPLGLLAVMSAPRSSQFDSVSGAIGSTVAPEVGIDLGRRAIFVLDVLLLQTGLIRQRIPSAES